MRAQFRIGSKRRVAFEFEMDEIVLDCSSREGEEGKSVWQKYRNQVQELSFRVLKLKQRRRGSAQY